MEKNKSIDGLSLRRTKKTITKQPTVRKIAVFDANTKKNRRTINHQGNSLIKNSSLTSRQVLRHIPQNPEEAIDDFLKPVTTFNFDAKNNKLKAEKNEFKNKTKKPKKKVSKLKKIIISIVLMIVSLVIIMGGILIFWGNDIITKITGGHGNLWDALSALTNETYEPLKADENGRTNILAFGTSGYNMAGDEGNGKHDGAQLTDSIMMISLNQKTGDIAMLSLPRDLKVSRTCTATGKVNEVYWCNNIEDNQEDKGAEALMKEVENILGVEFQYYAHLNWGSLVQIVDTLGGITVTLDEDINDSWTKTYIKAGEPAKLNGNQALGLARARHGTESGDFSRGNSQQKILIGIKDKIYENNISLLDMLGLFSALGDNLRTNLSVSEIKTAAHLTFEFDFNKIRQISLLKNEENDKDYMTTGNINGISYVLPVAGAGNYTEIRKYVAEKLKEPEIKEPNTEIDSGEEKAE